MAINSVKATLILRNDVAATWASRNPVLAKGEIGAEIDTGLLKMGDGVTAYNSLNYINNLADVDNIVIKLNDQNEITIGDYGKEFYTYNPANNTYIRTIATQYDPMPANLEAKIVDNKLIWVEPVMTDQALLATQTTANNALSRSGGTMDGALTLARDPVNSLEAATKNYVDTSIANAGHLTRSIVDSLPTVANANANTIYMIKDTSVSGDQYKEYMLINNELVQVGDTSPNLSNYVQKISNGTEGNLVKIAADGSLIDTGIAATTIGQLPIATNSVLGGVKSSNNDNYVSVDVLGYMQLNRVATDLLYVPVGSEFILNGGTA